mmetsp:Transcript_29786/g.39631  ORF Transcript_29786/g.39631 Transcript_29786/m.39631 type:complete len:143 (-) Transcript_29786:428-856(-)|eukprot:CAMPEP_0185571364 /NCGR_PEP_ID=MMETSP0434-20130131/3418_1 /TAXON_ID=626734 ORGANISM="Favella taraikaensis, Strain Fe Narragansett Bay" /NCGR_SAMPLE_ID=MMETSP0434 /ASSEMBLY_ACC=CAM_ASM_000379 /LENGTH=142 /DNA_ID=CAMNT_0028186769 /DNA_START=2831 /DNA_END=3259 /DNA_ORIENTATION=-
MQEESKHFVRHDPIEEEASSGSSFEQDPAKKHTNDEVAGESHQKKSSILSKVRRGLRKLSLTAKKDREGETHQNGGKSNLNQNLMPGGKKETYYRDGPRSAQLRESPKFSLPQKPNSKLSSQQMENKELYSIAEENQQLESS